MIITFSGTNKGNNSSKKVAAAIGAMLSLSNNKKVCIIQISNDSVGIEDLYNGKVLNQSTVGMKELGIDEHGIDSMIRKSDTMKLLSEHYYTACNCMLKSDNRLDVLGGSKQKTFLEDVTSSEKTSSIKRIIEAADKFYNFVLVVMPNQEHIVEAFINVGETHVCCVRQSEKEEAFFTDKRNVLVVSNFDPESVYTLKYITKEYKSEGAKFKAFPMHYNTQYRDAYHGQSLLKWLYKNCNITTTDINYDFITALQKLTDYISDTEAEEIPEPSSPRKREKKKTEKVKKERKKKEKKAEVNEEIISITEE